MITNTSPIQDVEKEADCGRCQKCDPLTEGACCQNGAGLALASDMGAIAKKLGITENELDKYFISTERFGTKLFQPKQIRDGKPHGPCIFFEKDKGCKIYDARPTQCRVGTWGSGSESHIRWFFTNHCVKDEPQSQREWRLYNEVNEIGK